MILIIDLSGGENLKLRLRDGRKKPIEHTWQGVYRLSETLLSEIDRFLKNNQVSLGDLEDIKVIPGDKSVISNRIAKATVLGLKFKQS